ncbi:uncharacterized protein LOC109721473 [Ananas comosus]|uniref:Uncharacterized protein LOC109721473 n=1 Tax=Ananas comosus TaxID=4615 RepID=A0A6P5GHA3_ANACO|nr:uncharacterized protein LOC109721473 [Ananas comosus]
MARLDRFLVSTEWDQEFPLTKVESLPRVTSDHFPILLSSESNVPRTRKIFRFEDVWLTHEDLVSKLPGWWQEEREDLNIRGVKNKLMGEIHEIDKVEEQRDLTQDVLKKIDVLKGKLSRVLKDEEVLWRTRAKQHCLREGDGNTRFFHAIANGQRRTNRFFTPDESALSSFGEWSSLFSSNRVNPTNITHVTRPFDIEEIKQAEMDAGKLSTSPIDYAFICLIPNKEGAKRTDDFRPISLLNGIQKIISKVLANRLECLMSELIFPSQSSFLKRRNITDAYAAVCELMGWGSKLAVEGVGVAVLVNGEATNWIKMNRRVRQRDPLPPFLFLLIAECLIRMTNEATSNNLIKGLGLSDTARVTVVQYADDTFFFSEAKRSYMRNLKFLWLLFE